MPKIRTATAVAHPSAMKIAPSMSEVRAGLVFAPHLIHTGQVSGRIVILIERSVVLQ